MTAPAPTPDDPQPVDDAPSVDNLPSDAAPEGARPADADAAPEAAEAAVADDGAQPTEDPPATVPVGPSGRPLQVVTYAGKTVNWGVLVGIGAVLGLLLGVVLVVLSGDLNAAGWVVLFAVFLGAMAGGLVGLLLDLFARRSRRRR